MLNKPGPACSIAVSWMSKVLKLISWTVRDAPTLRNGRGCSGMSSGALASRQQGHAQADRDCESHVCGLCKVRTLCLVGGRDAAEWRLCTAPRLAASHGCLGDHIYVRAGPTCAGVADRRCGPRCRGRALLPTSSFLSGPAACATLRLSPSPCARHPPHRRFE